MTENERSIYTGHGRRGDVQISLTYPKGGGGTRATLRVEDVPSGETLVDVDLDPEQYINIMSSGVTIVTGAHVTTRPERIGRRMQNTSAEVRLGTGVDLDAEAERKRATFLAEGWEAVRIDKTNFGRRVVAYRWIVNEEGD